MEATNKLIEDAVAELETLTGDDYQTEYYPVSPDWLRTKLTTTLSQLEEESTNKVLDLLERAGTKNNPLPLMDFSTHGFEKDYISRSLLIKALTTSVTAVDGLNNTCTKHVKYM